MSQALQEVLKAESEAKKLLDEANRQASEIVENARKEARLTLSQAREQAHRKAEQLLHETVKRTEEEKDRAVTEARKQATSPERLPPEKLEEAVELIVKVIAWNDPG